MAWNAINRLLRFASGEFLLSRRPNGGDVVFVRALLSAVLLFFFAIALKVWFLTGGIGRFCFSCWTREIGANLPWFGGIFAALYIGLYSRFSSQWMYLAGLYNQMMASQIQVPFGGEAAQERTYITWWAAFIEDAEDVHLALKKNYAAVIAGLLADPRIRQTYVLATVDGARRLSELQEKLEFTLGSTEFQSLMASGEVLAAGRGASVPENSSSPPPVVSSSPPAVVPHPVIKEASNVRAIPNSCLHPGKIEVNSQYQRIIDLLITLATASLVLPPLFLRDFFGVRDEPLAIFLDKKVFASWALLTLAIFMGACFHYASAKAVKQAWGYRVILSPRSLERVMDGLFWGTIVSFVTGLAFFLMFVREG